MSSSSRRQPLGLPSPELHGKSRILVCGKLSILGGLLISTPRPRDGKNLSYTTLFKGLQECYGLSTPLATVLVTGGFLLIKRYTFSPIDLYDLDFHGGVEHNASLVHRDTPEGDLMAPIPIVHEWVDKLRGDVLTGSEGFAGDRELVNYVDAARMRIRRESESRKELDGVHAEIARGELAIMLGLWETEARQPGGEKKTGVPLDWLLDWFKYERLPPDWKPTHEQSLMDTVNRSKQIRTTIEEMRREGAEKEKNQ